MHLIPTLPSFDQHFSLFKKQSDPLICCTEKQHQHPSVYGSVFGFLSQPYLLGYFVLSL